MTSSAPLIHVEHRVQVADYAPGSSFGPRWLPTYELVWLLSGSARMRTELRTPDGGDAGTSTEVLLPGTLALSRPGEWDYFRWDDHRPSRHAYVHFELLDAGGLGNPSGWPRIRSMAEAPVLEGLCAYLLELAAHGSAHSKHRSDQIVGLVVDLFVSGPWHDELDHPPEVVDRVIDHVAERWRRDGIGLLGVGELAEAAHVSAGHLHRVFHRAYGQGPARSLELCRLSRAATALQRSNATITEVARAHGFANPYHFSRRFSATYGAPPQTFRRGQQLTDPLWPVRAARLVSVARRLFRTIGF